jgi:hypothetical protein
VGGNFPICAPFNGAQNEQSATVAFDGTNFLVTWFNVIADSQNIAYGAFVSPSGAVGTPFAIGQTISADRNPLYTVFNGSNYFVVWNFDNPVWSVYGRFVTPSGTFPGNEFSIVTNENKSLPCLAFDGANYLLCWNVKNVNSGATNSDVQFQFLNAGGQPMGPQFTPFTAHGNEVPVIAVPIYDGKRFVSVATLSAGGITPTNNAGIYGAFIPASPTPPADVEHHESKQERGEVEQFRLHRHRHGEGQCRRGRCVGRLERRGLATRHDDQQLDELDGTDQPHSRNERPPGLCSGHQRQ